MAALQEVFEYSWRRLPLSEVEEQARELHAKYRAFASAYQP